MLPDYLPDLALYLAAAAGGLRLGRSHRVAGRFVCGGAGLLLACVLAEILVNVLASGPEAEGGEPERSLLVAWTLLGQLRFVGTSLLVAAIFAGRGGAGSQDRSEGEVTAAARGGVVALGLLLYAAIPVAAGHGIGTVGLLLVLGRSEEWLPGQGLGWLGLLVALASAAVRGRRPFLALFGYALVCLVASALSFAEASDAFLLSALATLPLLLGTALVLRRCWRAFRESVPAVTA